MPNRVGPVGVAVAEWGQSISEMPRPCHIRFLNHCWPLLFLFLTLHPTAQSKLQLSIQSIMSEPQQNGPLNLLRPLLLLSMSAYYIIPTVISLILNFQISTFFHLDDFKDAWFARFWAYFGPLARDFAADSVMPLLQNHARGVCLDIGPGSGQWLYLFQKANNPDITKIYGIEPNPGMHKALRENAVKAGLGDIYEIIGCGAEELQTKGGLQKETIDTIITVQCLCSIPTPELIIKELFPLLKAGGQWLVYEHVKTKYQGDFVGYWQSES